MTAGQSGRIPDESAQEGGDEAASSLLLVPEDVWRGLLGHLTAAALLEGVGLLGGRDDGATVRAEAFYPGSNVDASPTRYTMEPAEVLAAFRAMEAAGGRLVAIVHSHPSSPPIPSVTDLVEARYPDAFLLIVGLAGAEPLARCWRLIPGRNAGSWEAAESRVVVEGRPPEPAERTRNVGPGRMRGDG